MSLLTLMIFLPLIGALALALLPDRRTWRWAAASMSGVVLALGVALAAQFDWGSGALQFEERTPWIPSLGASYHLAVDGLSLPLILLTALLTFLALIYSWNQEQRPRILRPVPCDGNRADRGVQHARPAALLRLLRGRAGANVLHHRHLGPRAAH
jgi:NADH:ubiquinone oxidoreductase subunit 4 (subunit M)